MDLKACPNPHNPCKARLTNIPGAFSSKRCNSAPETSGFNPQSALDFAAALSHLMALITTVWSLCLDKGRVTKGEVFLFSRLICFHCHTLCPWQQPQWEGGSLLRGSNATFIAASFDTWRDCAIVSKVPDDLFTFKTTSWRSSSKWQISHCLRNASTSYLFEYAK